MSRILIFALVAVLGTPAAPQQTQPTQSRTLMALEGAAFDRAFVAQMIKANEEALEEWRKGPL
jgi:uncharacterized protein (DUF305 family)